MVLSLKYQHCNCINTYLIFKISAFLILSVKYRTTRFLDTSTDYSAYREETSERFSSNDVEYFSIEKINYNRKSAVSQTEIRVFFQYYHQYATSNTSQQSYHRSRHGIMPWPTAVRRSLPVSEAKTPSIFALCNMDIHRARIVVFAPCVKSPIVTCIRIPCSIS